MEKALERNGLGKYLAAYVAMLVITGVETVLAFRHSTGTQLLASLLVLAFMGAALGVLYFMRLASENRPIMVGLPIFTLFVLAAMTYGWSDSFSILKCARFSK